MDKITPETHYVVSEGCWLWLGARDQGYGRFVIDGRGWYMHRWFYTRFVGPIPEETVLDHTCHRAPCAGGVLCRHRRCVNPDHLVPTLPRDNSARSSRTWATHCKHGHEFTEENTRIISGGRRQCIACQNRRSRAAWRAKNSPSPFRTESGGKRR